MASRVNEMERMAENGTATFANPDDYQAGIGDASVNLIVTGGGGFNGRLTWLNLRRFHVLRGCEKSAANCLFLVSRGAGVCFVSSERWSALNIWRTWIAVRRRGVSQPR